jgi:hypothetical protein
MLTVNGLGTKNRFKCSDWSTSFIAKNSGFIAKKNRVLAEKQSNYFNEHAWVEVSG